MENLNLPESVSAAKKDIRYVDTVQNLKNFGCKTVIVDGKTTSEYHLKLTKSGMVDYTFMSIVKGFIETATMTHADADGLLKIEYPICMIVESILANDMIEDSLKEIDSYLER